MRQAAANLMPAFGRRVAVPLPIDAQHPASPTPKGLCTEHGLVMERVHGTSLLRAQRAQLAALALRQGRAPLELERELRPAAAHLQRFTVAGIGTSRGRQALRAPPPQPAFGSRAARALLSGPEGSPEQAGGLLARCGLGRTG